MSIRLAMGVLAVCASVCVHASPVFTAGDVYWFSRKPMQLIEVTGGGSFASATPITVFPNWNSGGSLVFLEDGTFAYATISSLSGTTNGALVRIAPNGTSTTILGHNDPTGLAELGGSLYMTSSAGGTLSRIVNGAAVQLLSGFSAPRTLIPYEEGLLMSETTGGRIRKITFTGSTASSTILYSGLIKPMDMAVLGNYLYYTSVITSTATENVTAVMKIDLTTGTRTEHATGRTFYGLTVAGGRLLSSNYKTEPAGIWDVTAGGDYSTTQAWARDLQGLGDTLMATVPGTPPVIPPEPLHTPEPSGLLLMATGAALIAVRFNSHRTILPRSPGESLLTTHPGTPAISHIAFRPPPSRLPAACVDTACQPL